MLIMREKSKKKIKYFSNKECIVAIYEDKYKRIEYLNSNRVRYLPMMKKEQNDHH